jgi:inosose dehydratase
MFEMGAKVIGAAEVGNSVQGLQLPVIDAKPVFTEEQWKLVGRGFQEMAKIAEEKGIVLAYHHHMGTGVQTPAEIDRFMEETNGKVKLLFDTGHLVYSEGSEKAMLEVLKNYEGRIAHVHLKDIRPENVKKVIAEKLSFLDGVRLGTFTVPGDGFIDFSPVFDELERQNYEGWMVVEAEQDPAIADPYEYALKARQYIHKLTGL